MRRACVGVVLVAPFSMLMFFCGPPPEPPLQPAGSQAGEPTPTGPSPVLPLADAGSDAAHEGYEADRPRPTELADASVLGGGDAGVRAMHGGLAPEPIRRVVIAHRHALQACYTTEAQRDATLRGGITVNWIIEPSGTVVSAYVIGSTIHNAAVESCVLDEVRAWTFPSSNGISAVTFPFSFGIR